MLKMDEIDSRVYDSHIISQGLEFQVDKYYEPKERPMARRVSIVLQAINPKPQEKILDVGCGVGTFAFHCAKFKALAFGVDYSKESIKVAKELTKRYYVESHARFLVSDATRLPFKDSSFDKIVSADFIEHINLEDKNRLITEMLRVLKPQGGIVIFTPNLIREKIGALYWRFRHLLFRDKIPKTDLHFGLIDRRGFERLLKKNRLTFIFSYQDITRPYLAHLPFLRKFLSLNLLWVIKR